MSLDDPDFPAPAPEYRQERMEAATERGMAYLTACATVCVMGGL